MTTIDFAEVRHIAALARLGISEERIPILARELSGILEHMAVLQAIDTGEVAGDVAEDGAPLQPDAGSPAQLLRPLTAFAPAMRDGFFLVPRLATHKDAERDEDL